MRYDVLCVCARQIQSREVRWPSAVKLWVITLLRTCAASRGYQLVPLWPLMHFVASMEIAKT